MLKMNISFENKEGLEFLKSIDNNSINLILTDPPYIISKETGMNTFRDSILEKNESEAKLGGNNQIKTEKE
jgi:site-specific DNA-methyltransferase (adenine-specific)